MSAAARSVSRHAEESARTIAPILAVLHKWGIHTLGQLSELDPEQLRARLGPEAVRLWERAQGKATRLLKFVEPPETFNEVFEFDFEVETAEPLLFILRRFLEQLTRRLNAIYLVAKELTLRIEFTNKQKYERRFQIPQPSNDVDVLFRMLQTHLEGFQSEHPIVAVSLEAEPAKSVSQQFGLFETTLRNPNRLYETLARLSALLGPDRVGTPVLEDTHRPDAFHLQPFSWKISAIDRFNSRTAPLCNSSAGVKPPPAAALRRFRPRLAVSALFENDEPVHLRSLPISGAIADKRGPYHASGNWWDEKKWQRSEWDIEIEKSGICRFHTDGTGGTGKNWQLDGIYD